ncbi:MAG: gamma-glutamylcyclotransferase [Chromatiaceae bacterium]|nr:MAG: gamma-glutamylcyclotransferase [Chromatiaceae bacterium]
MPSPPPHRTGQPQPGAVRGSTQDTTRWFWRALLASALLSLAIAGSLWWVLLSPFGPQPPDGPPGVDVAEPQRVFVYGTLRRPWVRQFVLGRRGETQPALLPDHRRVGLDVHPQPGTATPGLLLEVSGAELRRLDRYERVGRRYRRCLLPLADGTRAWVYRRLR